MSEHKMIPEFEEFIKKIVNDIHLEQTDKEELEEEWKLHLYDHYTSLRKHEVDKNLAIKIVLEQFGDYKMLQEEVNRVYPNSNKQHVQKEAIIAAVCIIASMIGPALLIGAHFQAYFVLAPIQALIFAYVVHRFLMTKIIHTGLATVGFIAVYIYFITLLPKMHGTSLTFDLYTNHLFSLEWDRLTGMEGLFEFVTIHMLWYVIIFVQLLSNKNFTPAWERILHSSFQYWGMLLLGVFFARFQSSAEWGVLFLNVFLIYAFLQQTLAMSRLKSLKEKLIRFFVRKKVC